MGVYRDSRDWCSCYKKIYLFCQGSFELSESVLCVKPISFSLLSDTFPSVISINIEQLFQLILQEFLAPGNIVKR